MINILKGEINPMRKLLSIMLALTMILAMGVISASAANPTGNQGSTTAKYEVTGFYYDENGENPGGNNAQGSDYYFVIPTNVEIAGSSDTTSAATAVAEIRGVFDHNVKLTPSTEVVATLVGGTASATAGVSLTGAAVSNGSIVMPASLDTVQNVSGTISAAFAANKAPLMKGVYQGPISWTASIEA